jgi:hypothetical protein
MGDALICRKRLKAREGAKHLRCAKAAGAKATIAGAPKSVIIFYKKFPKSKKYIFKKIPKMNDFQRGKILRVLRLKTEQYAYMVRTPIIPVKILGNPVHFFNGGFT